MRIEFLCSTIKEVRYIIESFHYFYIVENVSGVAYLREYDKYFFYIDIVCRRQR